MGKAKIWLNKREIGSDILMNNKKLQTLEQHAIQSALNHVEAQFMNQFGFQGKFEVKAFRSNRYNFKLIPADARTGAVLKQHPGWLAQFVNNMKF